MFAYGHGGEPAKIKHSRKPADLTCQSNAFNSNCVYLILHHLQLLTHASASEIKGSVFSQIHPACCFWVSEDVKMSLHVLDFSMQSSETPEMIWKPKCVQEFSANLHQISSWNLGHFGGNYKSWRELESAGGRNEDTVSWKVCLADMRPPRCRGGELWFLLLRPVGGVTVGVKLPLMTRVRSRL